MYKVRHDGQKWAVDKGTLEEVDEHRLLLVAKHVKAIEKKLTVDNIDLILNLLADNDNLAFASYLAHQYNAQTEIAAAQ